MYFNRLCYVHGYFCIYIYIYTHIYTYTHVLNYLLTYLLTCRDPRKRSSQGRPARLRYIPIYIYIYIYTHTIIYSVYIYIYVYIERERCIVCVYNICLIFRLRYNMIDVPLTVLLFVLLICVWRSFVSNKLNI